MKKRVALITGAGGYLGSHLAKELSNNGWFVIGVDVVFIQNKYIDKKYNVNILNILDFQKVFFENTIDVVFHLAGLISVGDSFISPSNYMHTNVGGTINVLKLMEKFKVKNIIFSSSAAVYEPKNSLIKETDVITNNSPYGISKVCSENIINSCNVNYIIFRYFNLAGADIDGEFGENHFPETHLIPIILQDFTLNINGNTYNTKDGTCIRDYIHVSDISKAHVLGANWLLHNELSLCLNLGSGLGYSIFDIINSVEDVTKKKVKYTIGEKRKGDPPMLVADITDAQNILGYTVKYGLNKIIETDYKWRNGWVEKTNLNI